MAEAHEAQLEPSVPCTRWPRQLTPPSSQLPRASHWPLWTEGCQAAGSLSFMDENGYRVGWRPLLGDCRRDSHIALSSGFQTSGEGARPGPQTNDLQPLWQWTEGLVPRSAAFHAGLCPSPALRLHNNPCGSAERSAPASRWGGFQCVLCRTLCVLSLLPDPTYVNHHE